MKKYLSMWKSQQGVTLIELLVVVVILGVIAAVAIPMVIGNQASSYENTNSQNLAIVNEAVQRYIIDHGGDKFPTEGTTGGAGNIDWAKLTGKTNADGTAGGDLGPYIQSEVIAYQTDGSEAEEEWTITADGKVQLPSDAVGSVVTP